MGFEMLPIEEGDLDEADPPHDVFELTSDQRWIPERHRVATVSTDEPADEVPKNFPRSVEPDPGEEPIITNAIHEVECDLKQWKIGIIPHEEDWLFDTSKLDSSKVNPACTLDEMSDLFSCDQLVNKE